ncbi:Ribosomal RNA large subunit methyltransferase J [compost metagenome]
MAVKAGKSWLHVTLTVKSNKTSERGGLPASGMFIISPPFQLKELLKPAMPQLVKLLGQDGNATFSLESGG